MAIHTIEALLSSIPVIARPFALGEFAVDWRERAWQLLVVHDFGVLRTAEDGLLFSEPLGQTRFLCSVPWRQGLAEQLTVSSKPSLNYIQGPAQGTSHDIQVLSTLCDDFDYGEKIVVSACAHALTIEGSPILKLKLCNLLFEEAQHLEVITQLLDLDHSSRPWLAEDKGVHWDLVTRCETLEEYMLIEHCLFEGRGYIASAKGVYDLEERNVSGPVVRLFENIFRQETNHAITGFHWLKLLTSSDTLPRIRNALARFIETEDLGDISTFRGRRCRVPLHLLKLFFETQNLQLVEAQIRQSAAHCRKTGKIAFSQEDVETAEKWLRKWITSRNR